jgi:anti-anti-sigma factor
LSLSDGRPIIAIGGALDLSTAPPIRRMLSSVINEIGPDHPSLVLDLRRLEFMDTSGLALLIHARRSARERGGSVVLVGVVPRVRRVLAKTNLLGLFTVCTELTEATGS